MSQQQNNAENSPKDTHFPILISENEFAFGIWLFTLDKSHRPSLKGLYRDGIISKLGSMGFYKRYRDNNSYIFIREQENIIWEVEPCMMKDEVFEFVKKTDETLQLEYKGLSISIRPEKLRETLLRQDHLIFNENFLEHLSTHTKPLLRDAKDKVFMFFKNKIVVTDKNGTRHLDYTEIKDECIWRNQIIEREFKYIVDNNGCHFGKFISNVCNSEKDRYNAFISAIGYLLHNYSDQSKGQAVIAYDEEITDLKNPMGGTGKGLFANAIIQMRNVVKIDGKKFDPNDKFKYQDVTESTQVVWLDDVKPELGFETFHSVLTDGWSIEQKHKAQFYIKPMDSPKMFICSNSILKGNGSTNKRRQFIIEFSNYYSKKIRFGNEEPIKKEHGCIFFDNEDWDAQEWNMFFSFMLDCVQKYLNDGMQVYKYVGVNKNKLAQATNEDFCSWVEEQNFELGKRYETKSQFEDFRNKYYGGDSEFKQRGFTNWMKIFAESKDWKFIAVTSNSTQYFSFQELSS